MSLPETCPFCGAEPYTTASGEQCRRGDRWVIFSCDTSICAGQDLRRTQSRKCEDAERARLAARVAELEALAKQAREDEAWAKANDVTAATMPDGWIAFDSDVRRGVCGKTIMDAIRALRAKMENVKCEMGGAR